MNIESVSDYFLMDEDEYEEYIIDVDEYGEMTKIPYEPIFEVMGIEYVKKLIKKKRKEV